MNIVTIRNLEVRYGDIVALCGVDLEIDSRDFLGVIGPNGGGKSSLVKAILGLVPYSGEVRFSPEMERHGSPAIGYMPQISELDKAFPISVEEVVLSGLQSQKKLWGGYRKSDREKANALLKMCGIDSIARRPIGELSGGQLQRTLLCRALISDPVLLILDEPANFVDNRFEKELYEILKQLNQHMAIMMVSHDLGTITSYVKSIVCVNQHVHRHDSNIITPEQLRNYDCPIQVMCHGDIPHTVLQKHT